MNLSKDVYVFIGPPGSGKGSLSSLCVQELGWVQLSTGNLLRKHIAQETEIGKQIDFAIKSGKLVPDSLITNMVVEWFGESSQQKAQAIILDGFPRTVAQAGAFQSLLEQKFKFLRLHVVRFSITDDVIVERLCNRYICSNTACQAIYSLIQGSGMNPKKGMVCDACLSSLVRRDDDAEGSIRERLKVYHKHERSLLGFYENSEQPIIECDVANTLERVFEEFKQLIGSNGI